MQKEAKQRGDKLPGSERSTKRVNQQSDQGPSEEAEMMTLGVSCALLLDVQAG